MRNEAVLSGPPGDSPALSHGHERRLVFVLAGIQFSFILDFMIMMPLGPAMVQALDIDAQRFALLVSIYTLAAALSGLAMAIHADRFERKRVLLILFGVFAFALAWCALSTSYLSLLMARALAGGVGGVLGATVQTLIGDLVPFERRGRASGAVMSATSVATVLGVPLALMLATVWGWRAAFVPAMATALVCWALAVRHVPRVLPTMAMRPRVRHPLGALPAVLGARNCRLALLFMMTGAFATFTVIPYLALYLTGNLGLCAEEIALVYAVGGLAAFAGARGIGRLSDRWGKVAVYRAVALVSLGPIFLQTHLPLVSWGWILLCTTMFFVMVQGRAIPAMAITISAVEPSRRGAFLSLNASLQQLALAAATYAGGALISLAPGGAITGYGTAGWLAIGLTAITVVLAGRIRLHTGRGTTKEAVAEDGAA